MYRAHNATVVYVHDVDLTEEVFLTVHPTRDCTKTPEEQAESLAAMLNGSDAVVAENSRLRAALAMSDQPCAYCTLPADEVAKCASGFPGCARADDMVGCPELGACKERDDALAVLGEAYIAVGSMLSDLGQLESDKGQKLMDNMAKASMGHEDVLPWPSFVKPA